MDLVDRFLNFSQWPTARKVAAVAFWFFLPAQLVQYAASRIVLARGGWSDLWVVDTRLLDLFYAVLIPTSLIVGLAAVRESRAGRDGGWTFYALFSIYVLTVALGGTYAAGDGNAVVIYPALAPMLIIPMLFDAAKSIYINVLAVSSLVAVAVATATGLDYAPAVVQRSIDVYQSPAVQMGVIALIVPPAVIGAILMVIVGAATRRERAMLAETRDRLDGAVSLISRYVPAELASGILAGTEAPASGYRRQKLTSFFSDIVEFTELAEELEPEELARMLNEYFTEMAEIAERHHGTVDELQGDGLILVFGAPTFRSDREHALDAVRAAIAMQRAIKELNERWRRDGLDVAIQVRMGINTGVVTVGHFGSGSRLKYTVLGKHVNLAARIQAICDPGKVLISHATWLLVDDEVQARSLGAHEFKGVTRPVEVHELV